MEEGESPQKWRYFRCETRLWWGTVWYVFDNQDNFMDYVCKANPTKWKLHLGGKDSFGLLLEEKSEDETNH